MPNPFISWRNKKTTPTNRGNNVGGQGSSAFDPVTQINNDLTRSEQTVDAMLSQAEAGRAALQQLDSSPGATKAAHVAHKQANKIATELAERNFQKKYGPLGYDEIKHQITLEGLGITPQNPYLKPGNVKELSKDVDANCQTSDFLIPFLLEREQLGIILPEESDALNAVYSRLNDEQFTKLTAGAAIALLFSVNKRLEDIQEYFPQTLTIMRQNAIKKSDQHTHDSGPTKH